MARSERSVSGLSASGCELSGALSELKLSEADGQGDPEPTDAEVLDAAVDAIAGLLVRMGRMRDDRRRTESRLRRQMTTAAPMNWARTRLAGVMDRTRLGSAMLDRYRAARARKSADD